MKRQALKREPCDEAGKSGRGGVLTMIFFAGLGISIVLFLGYLTLRYLISKLGVISGLQ